MELAETNPAEDDATRPYDGWTYPNAGHSISYLEAVGANTPASERALPRRTIVPAMRQSVSDVGHRPIDTVMALHGVYLSFREYSLIMYYLVVSIF